MPTQADAHDGAPVLTGVSVSRIGEHAATFEATISPEGGATKYVLYATGKFCRGCEEVRYEVEIARGGTSAHRARHVKHRDKQLSEEWRFEYWVVATNATGTTSSEKVTFKTS
jgi:hypothetical protein